VIGDATLRPEKKPKIAKLIVACEKSMIGIGKCEKN
jgi:hypothetical protein